MKRSKMKRIAGVLILSLGSASLAGAGAVTAADNKQGPATTVAAYPRFSGTAKVNATSLHVDIKDWQLLRTEQGVRLPVTGFQLVQVISGKVDTEIAGKTEHRTAGDYWTVQAGETMTIHFPAHSQTARLKIVAIR